MSEHMHRFRSAACSHPGEVRDHNEDAALAGAHLVAVADGVGGSVYGEVASALAIDAIGAWEEAPVAEPAASARDAVEAAGERLAREIAGNDALRGMATTLTGLLLAGDVVAVLHVGDSRAYRLRHGNWQQLTRDDSLVQDLVDAGALSAEDAYRHPARAVVLQAVNGSPVEAHVSVLDVADGDRYLVCSDGLSDYVDEADIVRIVRDEADPARCAEQLVAATLAVGAPDNVTVVVADVVPTTGADD